MNIKETIISSLFFHVILLLIMAAVASYTTTMSGDLQSIVSVDLTMEEKDQPETVTAPADEHPVTSSTLPGEEAGLPNEAEKSPPEEAEETPEPEKKVEPVTEPAKIENIQETLSPPAGFASIEEYYQFVLMHKRIFGQKVRNTVSGLLGEALKSNQRHFYGGTAIIKLRFGSDGNLSEVFVESASPDLKAFFEEISWVTVPAPALYSLKFTGVQIEFTVHEGSMGIKVDAF